MIIETRMKERSRSIFRTARLAGLVCAMLVSLGAVVFAQGDEAPQMGGTANPTALKGKVYTRKFQTAIGVRELSYQVLRAAEHGLEEDLALFEGDIIVGSIKNGVVSYSAGRSDLDFRWVGGVVPYEIDGAYSAAERQIINNAINHWNGNTPYWLRQRNGETDYVRFVRNTTGLCSSWVGRQGFQQSINIDANACGTGATIHELGHAVGLWHEQSRVDRGNFVIINWANIQAGQSFNFQTYAQQGQDGQDMFDYDFGSIMHYGSFAFSRNGLPTVTRLDGTLINAQRTALSQGDIAGAVRFLTRNGPATFKLVNVNSGKCLDVANWSRNSGAPVNQYDCHGGANQRWYFWTVPGTHSAIVVNDYSGQCLDIPGGSLANGAQLQQFSCHGFGNQRFRYSYANRRLLNENSFKCLDIPNGSTANGVRVQQYTCHTGANQQWQVVW